MASQMGTKTLVTKHLPEYRCNGVVREAQCSIFQDSNRLSTWPLVVFLRSQQGMPSLPKIQYYNLRTINYVT